METLKAAEYTHEKGQGESKGSPCPFYVPDDEAQKYPAESDVQRGICVRVGYLTISPLRFLSRLRP